MDFTKEVRDSLRRTQMVCTGDSFYFIEVDAPAAGRAGSESAVQQASASVSKESEPGQASRRRIKKNPFSKNNQVVVLKGTRARATRQDGDIHPRVIWSHAQRILDEGRSARFVQQLRLGMAAEIVHQTELEDMHAKQKVEMLIERMREDLEEDRAIDMDLWEEALDE
jgi:hypothetical protein